MSHEPFCALKERGVSHTSTLELEKRLSSKKAKHHSRPFLVRASAYGNFKLHLAGEIK